MNRCALHYCAFYGSVESIELICSTGDQEFVGHCDAFQRTPMHYAAMSGEKKAVEAIFMAFKAQGKNIRVYGQREEDGDHLKKKVPPASMSPFKGRFDEDDKNWKKSTAQKKNDDFDDEDGDGFVIEEEGDEDGQEEFKVEHADDEGAGKLTHNLVNFFTKKAVLDQQDSR